MEFVVEPIRTKSSRDQKKTDPDTRTSILGIVCHSSEGGHGGSNGVGRSALSKMSGESDGISFGGLGLHHASREQLEKTWMSLRVRRLGFGDLVNGPESQTFDDQMQRLQLLEPRPDDQDGD